MQRQQQSSSGSHPSIDSLTCKSKLPQLIKTSNLRDYSPISSTREATWQSTRAPSTYLTPPSTPRRSSLLDHYSPSGNTRSNLPPKTTRTSSQAAVSTVDNHIPDGNCKLNRHTNEYRTSNAPSSTDSRSKPDLLSSRLHLPGPSSSKRSGETKQAPDHSRSASLPRNIESNLSPEMMFLIKEHAKTLAAINKIARRLKELELKVEDISKKLSKQNSFPRTSATSNCTNEEGETGAVGNILSDDSGGEYSRTTTGTVTDEDELLSLLDQIAKCSHQIKQTQVAQQYQSQALSSSLLRAYPQSASQSVNDARVGGNINNFTTGPSNVEIPRMSSPPATLRQPSLSALIFEPSIRNFLDSVNQLMDEKSCLSLNGSQACHPSAFQSLPLPPVEDILRSQINRARQLIEMKQQNGVESQLKLADKWLANQLLEKAQSQAQHQALNPNRATQGTWHH